MLSPQEIADVASLRKRLHFWIRFRWVALLAGLLVIVTALIVSREMLTALFGTTRHMSLRESPTGAELYFATQFAMFLGFGYLMTLLGAAIVGYAIARWRGDPTVRVLIALAERFDEFGAKEHGEESTG